MRYLAVARLRLWTALRSATPIFILAALPPLMAAAFESMPEPLFRAAADELLAPIAKAALFAWLIHGGIMVAACEAFGSRRLRSDLTSLPSDLMDSAPVGPVPRFWGEVLGIFCAALTIHACCLPLLAVAAVLSPLPTAAFVWIEAGIIALMILGSAGAAWKRLAPPTRWNTTRTASAGILFLILLLLALYATTTWGGLGDSLAAFIITPSMRAWAAVTASVENPLLLGVLLSMLYFGYLLYYFNSTRKPAQA